MKWGRIHVQRVDSPVGTLSWRLTTKWFSIDLNLYINDKEFLTLLGPSGCGKTTTLRIIGGFTTPMSGDVLFDGVRINDVPPYRRQINTVFQKYALFPHLNVFENVAFGLRMPKVEEQQDADGKVISRRKVKLSEEEIQAPGHGDAGDRQPQGL